MLLMKRYKGERITNMKRIRVYQDEPYKKLGDLYGLFFEDINHAADGGLYAELVQNRSFEFCAVDKEEYHALTAWEKSEDMTWEIRTQRPLHAENLHYLHIQGDGGARICNGGFHTGIHVEKGKQYDFSVFARTDADTARLPVCVAVEDVVHGSCAGHAAGTDNNSDTIVISGTEWTRYELVLTASETTDSGRLVLTLGSRGSCDLDMVSLFPRDTFMGRKNGLRRDIAEALREMQPKFMRFPGGCLTHDGSLNDHDRNSMYRWRRTLGPVEERPTWRNNWGYNQTLGLGYYEYFCFCEDIGAKPLPVLPGGFNPHKGEGAAMEELGAWVQEALDLIEFANGGTDTRWGRVRADMGHEEPFGLEYLGIGNEEIGEGFFERYPYFHKAIREKYPQIKLINTAGPFAAGEGYEAGWSSARQYGSDFVDEHYYASPEWFLANMHHYEDYDENGPRVFLGEYASWGNTCYNAIVEAAYMTHLERAKAVALACYAPMLCNADYVNWKPDMLWFNNHAVLKTPNYYVQKMFMENQGTDEVRFETEELSETILLSDAPAITGAVVLAGNDIEGTVENICFVDHASGKAVQLPSFSIGLDNGEHPICEAQSGDYHLEFSFRRKSGRKGFKLFFGRHGDADTQRGRERPAGGNTLVWEFGGWDNWDCNLSSAYNGRSSVISHRIFHVEDIDYTLRLEVQGRHIRTYVNGVCYNDTVDRLPELEELYIAASTQEDAAILKVVNLTGEEKATELVLEGALRSRAAVTSLSGHKLSAENTFEHPDTVTPRTGTAAVQDNRLTYAFPPHSVTVLRFT